MVTPYQPPGIIFFPSINYILAAVLFAIPDTRSGNIHLTNNECCYER